ncbi:Uncharacterised protein [Shigella sonnei]|nr:Uncharacterised protein [Shigella sonnei]
MCCGDRHPNITGKADRHCRRHLCRHALRIRHAALTNLLTDGHRYTTPANHGANAERQCYRHDDPHRSVLNGA